MKNKLISALTTKFSGVDAKILGRIADNILRGKTIETDEDVNSAVEEVTFADVLKSYGDARAAEATKSSVLNYEKKHGLKDGKPVEQIEDGDDPDTDDGDNSSRSRKPAKKPKDSEGEEKVPAWAKALIDSNSELKAELTAMKQGKITESRKAKFNKAIEGLSDLQKKVYSRVSLDNLSDEDFDSLMGEVASEVEEFAKENAGRDAAFSPLLGGDHHKGGDKEPTKEEMDAVLSHMNI